MNLYKINLHAGGFTGIHGETMHVQAGTAKAALDKAYKKFQKQYPKERFDTVVHGLELVEERW